MASGDQSTPAMDVPPGWSIDLAAEAACALARSGRHPVTFLFNDTPCVVMPDDLPVAVARDWAEDHEARRIAFHGKR